MDQTLETNVEPFLAFGIMAMLFLALAIILFVIIYQRKLTTQQTNLLEMEITAQRNAVASLIQGQEDERKRIAQELHDGIGALLSASKMYINRLGEGKLIDETIDNIRTITRNLLPTSLERFGLFAATEDLCKRVSDLGEIKMEFTHSAEKRFAMQQEFALYRIIQELTNNSLKYSKADLVSCTLNIVGDQLSLEYKDNGQGFDLSSYEKDRSLQQGLGLRGVATRAEVLQANIQMESEPSNGFFLQLKMKCQPQEETIKENSHD